MSERPTAYGLEYDHSCQSCGVGLEWCDDNRCFGCGLIVCCCCVMVFGHINGDDGSMGRHGTGDPARELESLRAKVTRLESRGFNDLHHENGELRTQLAASEEARTQAESALAEAREDSERLDWLDSLVSIHRWVFRKRESMQGFALHHSRRPENDGFDDHGYETAREAIDAARASEGEAT